MLDPDSFYQNGHELMKKNWLHPHSWWKTRVLLQSQMTSHSLRQQLNVRLDRLDSSHTNIRNSPFDGEWSRGQFRRAPVWWERQEKPEHGALKLRIFDLKLGEPPTSISYDEGAQHPLGSVCLKPPFVGEWSKAAIREYRANPQYRKTRRAKGLGILACAQCACMREQEPKVLHPKRSSLIEDPVDSVITLFLLTKMSWYSGATARPPGEWLHPGLHPWWGYGAHAHAISALSQSIATSLDERGFYQQLIFTERCVIDVTIDFSHLWFSQPVSS